VYYAPTDPDLKDVETRQGDYVIKQLADRMNRDDLVGDIVSNWHKFGQRRKTLVLLGLRSNMRRPSMAERRVENGSNFSM
jgi:hypothetical protein